jgi:hypothetical protein
MTSHLVNSELNNKRNRIIGGLYGLEYNLHTEGDKPSFLSDRDILLINARSGIWLLVNQLKPRKAWIPSYLCHTIIKAIDRSITTVRYYEVNYDLDIASESWINEVEKGDIVVFIDYFGFPYSHSIGARVRERGAIVLEDASQALLSSHVGLHSDYALFSPRKWIGVPDGGILRCPEGCRFVDVVPLEPDASWWLKAYRASVLRRLFDEGVPTREWFELFREAEETAPIGPYSMSQLSQIIISCSVDYSILARKRIDNYTILLEELSDYAIFSKLEPDTVPLGFPVRIDNRDAVRHALFDEEIYPPVHWSIDGIVPRDFKESHRLAQNIMTIPCDQRYKKEDIKRIIKLFLKSCKGNM